MLSFLILWYFSNNADTIVDLMEKHSFIILEKNRIRVME
jgi:hypothetical protein